MTRKRAGYRITWLAVSRSSSILFLANPFINNSSHLQPCTSPLLLLIYTCWYYFFFFFLRSFSFHSYWTQFSHCETTVFAVSQVVVICWCCLISGQPRSRSPPQKKISVLDFSVSFSETDLLSITVNFIFVIMSIIKNIWMKK